jgi:hypothetical protein
VGDSAAQAGYKYRAKQAQIPEPTPVFENIFRKPTFPPPAYPVTEVPTKSDANKQDDEATALISKLMSETGIKDTDTLIQKLKVLINNETRDILMAKCPELRAYVTKHGNRVTYLDVEDVLRVVIRNSRICNSDIAQLNNELYDILSTNYHYDSRGKSLCDYSVVRNNTQLTVYDFAKSDFPAMYNHLKKWSEHAADHILIA